MSSYSYRTEVFIVMIRSHIVALNQQLLLDQLPENFHVGKTNRNFGYQKFSTRNNAIELT